MEWREIATVVGKAAPLLGGLLGGPAGAAVGGLVASALGTPATPDAVSQALATNPDAAVKLAEVEARRAVELQALLIQSEQSRLAAETAAMVAVNTTMQAEAAADHWPTYSWRPAIGFAFALYVVSLFGLPLFHLKPEVLSTDVVLAIGSILGVASWFRGKAQADPRVPTDNRG